MQITMNIDTDQLNETFVDLFKNLPDEKKEEMALKVFTEWLKNPLMNEVSSHHMGIISEYINGTKNPYHYSDREKVQRAVDEIKKTVYYNTDYRDHKEKFESVRDVMFDECRKQTIAYFKKDLSKMIEEDEGIQKLKNDIFDYLKKEFPNIIQNALSITFASNLSKLQTDITENIMKTMRIDNDFQNLILNNQK